MIVGWFLDVDAPWLMIIRSLAGFSLSMDSASSCIFPLRWRSTLCFVTPFVPLMNVLTEFATSPLQLWCFSKEFEFRAQTLHQIKFTYEIPLDSSVLYPITLSFPHELNFFPLWSLSSSHVFCYSAPKPNEHKLKTEESVVQQDVCVKNKSINLRRCFDRLLRTDARWYVRQLEEACQVEACQVARWYVQLSNVKNMKSQNKLWNSTREHITKQTLYVCLRFK